MNNESMILLARKLWTESKDKQELKQRITRYMSRNYPNYTVIEIHKYYAICEVVKGEENGL